MRCSPILQKCHDDVDVIQHYKLFISHFAHLFTVTEVFYCLLWINTVAKAFITFLNTIFLQIPIFICTDADVIFPGLFYKG